jgi:hypothetical protein
MKTKNITINIPEEYDDVRFNEKTNEIEFIKKDNKPRSWKEYCEQKQHTDCFRVFLGNDIGSILKGNRYSMPCVNEFDTEEESKAIIAFCKLVQLRNSWWGDWRPDWKDGTYKYVIEIYSGEIDTDFYSHVDKLLAFPTPEMRDNFLEAFKDLIEEAKILL